MLPMSTRLRNPRRSLVSSPVSVPVGSYQPWSPLALRPRLWLDASDLTTITASSGAVSEWRDKSGNGYAFTQSTSTLQPTTGTTTLNGLNVLSFDGIDDWMVSTAAASEWKFLHDGTEYLVGLVAQRAAASVFAAFYATQAAVSSVQQVGTRFVFNAANNWATIVYAASGAIAANATISLGSGTATRVVSARISPASSVAANRLTLQLDAAQPVTPNASNATVSAADPYGTLHLGTVANTTTSTLSGYIAELVFVTGSGVTNQNRQLLHNYLNRKWAVY